MDRQVGMEHILPKSTSTMPVECEIPSEQSSVGTTDLSTNENSVGSKVPEHLTGLDVNATKEHISISTLPTESNDTVTEISNDEDVSPIETEKVTHEKQKLEDEPTARADTATPEMSKGQNELPTKDMNNISDMSQECNKVLTKSKCTSPAIALMENEVHNEVKSVVTQELPTRKDEVQTESNSATSDVSSEDEKGTISNEQILIDSAKAVISKKFSDTAGLEGEEIETSKRETDKIAPSVPAVAGSSSKEKVSSSQVQSKGLHSYSNNLSTCSVNAESKTNSACNATDLERNDAVDTQHLIPPKAIIELETSDSDEQDVELIENCKPTTSEKCAEGIKSCDNNVSVANGASSILEKKSSKACNSVEIASCEAPNKQTDSQSSCLSKNLTEANTNNLEKNDINSSIGTHTSSSEVEIIDNTVQKSADAEENVTEIQAATEVRENCVSKNSGTITNVDTCDNQHSICGNKETNNVIGGKVLVDNDARSQEIRNGNVCTAGSPTSDNMSQGTDKLADGVMTVSPSQDIVMTEESCSSDNNSTAHTSDEAEGFVADSGNGMSDNYMDVDALATVSHSNDASSKPDQVSDNENAEKTVERTASCQISPMDNVNDGDNEEKQHLVAAVEITCDNSAETETNSIKGFSPKSASSTQDKVVPDCPANQAGSLREVVGEMDSNENSSESVVLDPESSSFLPTLPSERRLSGHSENELLDKINQGTISDEDIDEASPEVASKTSIAANDSHGDSQVTATNTAKSRQDETLGVIDLTSKDDEEGISTVATNESNQNLAKASVRSSSQECVDTSTKDEAVINQKRKQSDDEDDELIILSSTLKKKQKKSEDAPRLAIKDEPVDAGYDKYRMSGPIGVKTPVTSRASGSTIIAPLGSSIGGVASRLPHPPPNVTVTDPPQFSAYLSSLAAQPLTASRALADAARGNLYTGPAGYIPRVSAPHHTHNSGGVAVSVGMGLNGGAARPSISSMHMMGGFRVPSASSQLVNVALNSQNTSLNALQNLTRNASVPKGPSLPLESYHPQGPVPVTTGASASSTSLIPNPIITPQTAVRQPTNVTPAMSNRNTSPPYGKTASPLTNVTSNRSVANTGSASAPTAAVPSVAQQAASDGEAGKDKLTSHKQPPKTPTCGSQISPTILLEQPPMAPYKAPIPPSRLKYTSVKHYICRYCGEEFALSFSLLNHQRHQSLKISYNCQICNTKLIFYNRCALLSHIHNHKKTSAIEKRDARAALMPVLKHINVFTIASLPDLDSMLTTPVMSLDDIVPNFTKTAVVQRRVQKSHSKVKKLTANAIQEEPSSEKIMSTAKESCQEVVNITREVPDEELTAHEKTSATVVEITELKVINPSTSNSTAGTRGDSKQEQRHCSNLTRNPVQQASSVQQGSSDESTKLPSPEERVKHATPEKTEKTMDPETTTSPTTSNTSDALMPDITAVSEDFKLSTCHECSTKTEDLQSHFYPSAAECHDKPLGCKTCNKLLVGECSLKAHKRIHACQPPHICPECGYQVQGDISAFDFHVNQVCCHLHHHMLLDCHLCKSGNLFNNFDNFLMHYVQVHCKIFLKCSLCPMAFKTKSVLLTHKKDLHSISPDDDTAKTKTIYKCSLCKEIISQLKAMKLHLCKHLSTIVRSKMLMYICPAGGCGFTSGNLLPFKDHLKAKHPNLKTLSKCHQCFKSFENLSQLRTHVLDQHPEWWDETDADKLGKQSFNAQSSRKADNNTLEYFRKVLEEDPLKCDKCCILFSCKQAHTKHLEIHKPITRTIHCEDRKRKAKEAGGLRASIKKLKADNAVDATSCDAKSETSSVTSTSPNRNADVPPQVKVAEAKRLKCGECTQMFGSVDSLAQHQLSEHQIKMTFPCHLCSEVFDSKALLTKHQLLSHSLGLVKDTSAQPYQCWICEKNAVHKAYAKHQLLEKHLISYHKKPKSSLDMKRIRTPAATVEHVPPSPTRQLRKCDDQQFYCAKCPYTSSNRSEFKDHIIKHRADMESMQCQECGLCFSVLPSLKRHLMVVHKIRNLNKYSEDTDIDLSEPNDIDYSPIKMPVSYDISSSTDSDSVAENDSDASKVVSNECTVCYKTFDSQSQLHVHMRQHGMAFICSKRRMLAADKIKSPTTPTS